MGLVAGELGRQGFGVVCVCTSRTKTAPGPMEIAVLVDALCDMLCYKNQEFINGFWANAGFVPERIPVSVMNSAGIFW